MGLTSSLFVGLSGMQVNESRMDVIGNNISNVNTYAFKSQRVSFQTQFYNTLNFGSAPNGTYGGTNPIEIGTGATVGAVTKDFSNGAPETTGIKTDLAVQGDGLFIVQDTEGANHYTRDGSFQFNSENYLLSSDGYFVQGYGVDANFNIVEGTLSKLRVPTGEITTAESTSKAYFSGDLNASGTSALTRDASDNIEIRGNIRGVSNSQILNVGGADITGATLLTDVEDANGQLFDVGNFIVLENAVKGGKTLPQEELLVEATTTVDDYLAWLEDVLGINTDSGLSDLDGDGVVDTVDNVGNPIKQPGVRLATDTSAAGAQTYIEIVSNMGAGNNLDFNGSEAITIKQASGANKFTNNPFAFAEPDGFELADIESVKTSFRAYDSLGIPMDVDVTIVMVDKTDNGITWRYFAESTDDTDDDRVVGSGTITFDPNGNFLEASNGVITLDRTNTGAATPQTVELDFSNMDGYSITSSAISLLSQDGFQSGTLQDFSIGTDGIITGSFTNGLTRQLGQVVLATFRNYEGLLSDTNNMYSTGPNSGQPVIKKPQELGAGSLNSTALELSNVDLSKEFINLIVSSTGFSASSKVIQTSNDLLTQLINLTR